MIIIFCVKLISKLIHKLRMHKWLDMISLSMYIVDLLRLQRLHCINSIKLKEMLKR